MSFRFMLLSSETRQPVQANISINARSRISVHAIRIRSSSSEVNAFFFFFVTLIFLTFRVGSFVNVFFVSQPAKNEDIDDRLLFKDKFDIPLLLLYAYKNFGYPLHLCLLPLFQRNNLRTVLDVNYIAISSDWTYFLQSASQGTYLFSFLKLSLYSVNSVDSFLICTSRTLLPTHFQDNLALFS